MNPDEETIRLWLDDMEDPIEEAMSCRQWQRDENIAGEFYGARDAIRARVEALAGIAQPAGALRQAREALEAVVAYFASYPFPTGAVIVDQCRAALAALGADRPRERKETQ
jgi:hypothetical protein